MKYCEAPHARAAPVCRRWHKRPAPASVPLVLLRYSPAHSVIGWQGAIFNQNSDRVQPKSNRDRYTGIISSEERNGVP